MGLAIDNHDTDGDGLSDGEEMNLAINPLSADSDGDGYGDKQEVQSGSSPVDAASIPNQAPVANAGADRAVRQGSLVTLDGGASMDPDHGPSALGYGWNQTGGVPVTLSNSLAMSPNFVPAKVGAYAFSLIVNDGADDSTPDGVTITVPILGDIDLDGDVDSNDLKLIIAARGKPADGPNDLRDLDGNMKIDTLDEGVLDTDADGKLNGSDNCTLKANANQRDTNNDGFGNLCDPDLDNNGIVNAADQTLMQSRFYSKDPNADLNGDGFVNFGDLAILKSLYGKAPGPSGLVP